MSKNKQTVASIVALVLLGAAIFTYWRWHSHESPSARADMLARMPGDTNVAIFLDLAQLRSSPFLAQLFAWAPRPAPDSDYTQFLQATGFNYERDLDRVALAVNRQGQILQGFAIAEGRFDRRKIESYGAQFGSLKTAEGRTLYALPVQGSSRKAFFAFLRDDRIAWANDSSYFQKPAGEPTPEWREHFSRLGGTPLFVILRQDSGAAAALAQAPGGLRSPQLASLLNQLQWISIGGKPEGNSLRVVIDGECQMESTVHQLKEVLGGIVILAQQGLNDPKARKQLDPQLRQGYLNLLQSVEVKQLDRGSSKSVRVVFDVTPELLQSARKSDSVADPPTPKPARQP